jgi:hypothetical protein
MYSRQAARSARGSGSVIATPRRRCQCGWEGAELVPFFSTDTAHCPKCAKKFFGVKANEARKARPSDPIYVQSRLAAPEPAQPPEKARDTDAIMGDLFALATELSPENLTCDGELSSAEVAQKEQRLLTSWHALEDELGYKIEQEEVWDWYLHTTRRR